MAAYFLTVRLPYILLGAGATDDPDRLAEPQPTHEKKSYVFYEVDSKVIAGKLLEVFRYGKPSPGIPGNPMAPVGSMEGLRKLMEGVSTPMFELVNAANLELAQRVLFRQDLNRLKQLLSYPDWDPHTTGFVVGARERLLAAEYRKAKELEPLIREELAVVDQADAARGVNVPSGLKDWLSRLDWIEQEMERLIPSGSFHAVFTLKIDRAAILRTEWETFPLGSMISISCWHPTRYVDPETRALWFDLGRENLPFVMCWDDRSRRPVLRGKRRKLLRENRRNRLSGWSLHDAMPKGFLAEDQPSSHQGLVWCRYYYWMEGIDHGGPDTGAAFIAAFQDLEDAILEACYLAPRALAERIGDISRTDCWATALLYLAMKRMHPLIRADGNPKTSGGQAWMKMGKWVGDGPFKIWKPHKPSRDGPTWLDQNDLIIMLLPDIRSATGHAFNLFRRIVKSASSENGKADLASGGHSGMVPSASAQSWADAPWHFESLPDGIVLARNRQLRREYAKMDTDDLLLLCHRWRRTASGFVAETKRTGHYDGDIAHEPQVNRATEILATAIAARGIDGASRLGRCLRRPDDSHLHYALATLDELEARLRAEAASTGPAVAQAGQQATGGQSPSAGESAAPNVAPLHQAAGIAEPIVSFCREALSMRDELVQAVGTGGAGERKGNPRLLPQLVARFDSARLQGNLSTALAAADKVGETQILKKLLRELGTALLELPKAIQAGKSKLGDYGSVKYSREWSKADAAFRSAFRALDPYLFSLRKQFTSPGEPAGAEAAQLTALPRRVQLAYQQYLQAERECPGKDGRAPTDRQCYDWLVGHNDGDTLRAFETWKRYVRKARSHLGEQKNAPRAGRPHGRSIVTAKDIEPLGTDEAD